MTGEPRIYSAGEGSNDQTKVPVVAFRAYTVPCAAFVAKSTLPSAYVIDACTGPFGANDHRRTPVVTSRATTRPFPPNAPPPTNTVAPETAGEEIPASTWACQASVPVARLMAYTLPSFEGAMSRGPAMAGDAATEPGREEPVLLPGRRVQGEDSVRGVECHLARRVVLPHDAHIHGPVRGGR